MFFDVLKVIAFIILGAICLSFVLKFIFAALNMMDSRARLNNCKAALFANLSDYVATLNQVTKEDSKPQRPAGIKIIRGGKEKDGNDS